MDFDPVLIRMLSAALVFIGLVYTSIQLKATRKIHSENHDWNRKVTALHFSFADDPKLIDILSRMDEHFQINSRNLDPILYERMEELRFGKEKKDGEYKEVFNDIHFALARLESMCIAIEQGIADEDVCKLLLKSRVITFNEIFSNYINKSRKNRNSKKLFEHLEAYAELWSKNEIGEAKKPLLGRTG